MLLQCCHTRFVDYINEMSADRVLNIAMMNFPPCTAVLKLEPLLVGGVGGAGAMGTFSVTRQP